MTPQEIVSDAEVERVHAYANFGHITKRSVVDNGVLQYAFGFTAGHTQDCILVEHGLITLPRGIGLAKLTPKGKTYFQALGPMVISSMLRFS